MIFNTAFSYLHIPPRGQQQAETRRDKETLCDTRHPTDSRPHRKKKTFDKRHHSNPLWEYAAQSTVDLTPDQPAAIVSRGVGVHVRGFAWVRDDHRSVVIYLFWLVALSSSVWVAHCSIIHQIDDWLWQDAEPGGVRVCLKSVCWGRAGDRLQNVKKGKYFYRATTWLRQFLI